MADGTDMASVAYAAFRLALGNTPLARAVWRRMLAPKFEDLVMDRREGGDGERAVGRLVGFGDPGSGCWAEIACTGGEVRRLPGSAVVAVPTRGMVEAAALDAEAEIGSGRA